MNAQELLDKLNGIGFERNLSAISVKLVDTYDVITESVDVCACYLIEDMEDNETTLVLIKD